MGVYPQGSVKVKIYEQSFDKGQKHKGPLFGVNQGAFAHGEGMYLKHRHSPCYKGIKASRNVAFSMNVMHGAHPRSLQKCRLWLLFQRWTGREHAPSKCPGFIILSRAAQCRNYALELREERLSYLNSRINAL